MPERPSTSRAAVPQARRSKRVKGVRSQVALGGAKRRLEASSPKTLASWACYSLLRPRQTRFFVAFMPCRASIRDGDTRSIATPVSWPRLLRNSIGERDG